MQQQERKNDDWIYPSISDENLKKKFFAWGDSNFKETPKTRKLINEINVAAVFLKLKDGKSNYDHVPLYSDILLGTPPGEKYLLYCLGSSSPSTEVNVRKMVSKSFDMLNRIAPHLIAHGFQIWIVANPAAYKLYTQRSIMDGHVDTLHEKINVFDWYSAILENTNDDFKNIHYCKHGYYDFQQLILYRVMQNITSIPVLRLEIERNTPLPYIKEEFFLRSESKHLAEKVISSTTDSTKLDFKLFYEILYEAYEIENKDTEITIRSSVAVTIDGTMALRFDPKTYHRGGYGKVVRQYTYKKLNLDVAIKVVDARQLKEAAALFEDLKKLKHPNIIVTHDVATGGENYNILYIVTEFCQNGSLFKHICDRRPTKANFVQWIQNIANALIYLHEDKLILHCDIKPGNVILDSYHNAKICDVDSIQYVKSLDACKLPDNVQCTNRYTAPELQKRELCDSRVDVWSYSIVVLELIVAILSDDFCKDLKEGKHKSLDEILTLIPKTLQNLLRAGLKTERTERSFMRALIPLLKEVEAELGKMTEAAWQKCATGKLIEKHNNQNFLKNCRAVNNQDHGPATKVKN